MPIDLSPKSTVNAKTLPATGSASDVQATLAYNIYTTSAFNSGAADQVAYVYGKLGGNILDIEIEPANVYKAYEESCLEYSYLLNTHQAKNVLSDMLGGATGSFDEDGEMTAYRSNGDDLNIKPNLKLPRFTLFYSAHVAASIAAQSGLNSHEKTYSASFDLISEQQDYDLQDLIASNEDFTSLVGNSKLLIDKVYFKPNTSIWRFFGHTNSGRGFKANTYGQYGANSTFEAVPVWQQELYASAFENSLKVRASHYSYEIQNNRLRLYPTPSSYSAEKMWVRFRVANEAYEEEADRKYGADGINNVNSLPFPNVPFENINSVGKHWIRRFALALCKETLGQVRSKLGSIPIPGNDVTLNGSDLLSQGKEEQDKLREELKTVFDELTYGKLAQSDQELQDATENVLKRVPQGIYVG
jgi:hypothetical protein